MPVNNPANLATKVCYGTQLTIHTQLQTTLRTLGAADEIFDISIVRLASGNRFMAVISYEDAP
jgi:hypothetical protein